MRAGRRCSHMCSSVERKRRRGHRGTSRTSVLVKTLQAGGGDEASVSLPAAAAGTRDGGTAGGAAADGQLLRLRRAASVSGPAVAVHGVRPDQLQPLGGVGPGVHPVRREGGSGVDAGHHRQPTRIGAPSRHGRSGPCLRPQSQPGHSCREPLCSDQSPGPEEDGLLRVRAVQPEARVRERVLGPLWDSGKPLFRHRNIEESTAAPFFMAVGFVLVWILGRREIWSLPLLLVIPFPFDWMAGSGGVRPCPRAGGVQWRQPAGPAHASTTWSWWWPVRK